MARRLDEPPPEVWQEIISYLPKTDIRNCRLVSNVFSCLSTPVLFTSLTITFGAYDCVDKWGSSISVSDKRKEGRAIEQAAQLALVDRIASDPPFASLIRSLRICVYEDGVARSQRCELLMDSENCKSSNQWLLQTMPQ